MYVRIIVAFLSGQGGLCSVGNMKVNGGTAGHVGNEREVVG